MSSLHSTECPLHHITPDVFRHCVYMRMCSIVCYRTQALVDRRMRRRKYERTRNITLVGVHHCLVMSDNLTVKRNRRHVFLYNIYDHFRVPNRSMNCSFTSHLFGRKTIFADRLTQPWQEFIHLSLRFRSFLTTTKITRSCRILITVFSSVPIMIYSFHGAPIPRAWHLCRMGAWFYKNFLMTLAFSLLCTRGYAGHFLIITSFTKRPLLAIISYTIYISLPIHARAQRERERERERERVNIYIYIYIYI